MKVIIAAAGTGGHINPGIAIANKIRQEEPDSEIIFIGTKRGLENDLVPKARYGLKTIDAYGVTKKVDFKTIQKMLKTFEGFGDSKKFIKQFNPDLVIGMGGYICGPVLTAAYKLGYPTMLHESNAYPGKAIKLLSKKVDTILVGFKEAKERLPGAKNVVVTGNPTKLKNLNLTNIQKDEIIKKYKLNPQLPVVLIFGGSQGAKRINETIINIILGEKIKDYQIIWATGPSQYEEIAAVLKEENVDIENVPGMKILPYIYNMEEVMNACDVVVARSGAMTITEIAKMKKPSIFIPLPSMSANRQEDNARVLEKLGAAMVILNDDLNADILSNYIFDIINNKDNMKSMGEKAGKIDKENVEDIIYKEIEKLVNRK